MRILSAILLLFIMSGCGGEVPRTFLSETAKVKRDRAKRLEQKTYWDCMSQLSSLLMAERFPAYQAESLCRAVRPLHWEEDPDPPEEK